ncbi:hypothetical protein U3A55_11095 [Salarchaeum sp. III]|uniref:hypothetical protein n=1 Tax=Salarchaeum sp. III TaxID=3107927 RepID=UPI002ED85D43
MDDRTLLELVAAVALLALVVASGELLLGLVALLLLRILSTLIDIREAVAGADGSDARR